MTTTVSPVGGAAAGSLGTASYEEKGPRPLGSRAFVVQLTDRKPGELARAA